VHWLLGGDGGRLRLGDCYGAVAALLDNVLWPAILASVVHCALLGLIWYRGRKVGAVGTREGSGGGVVTKNERV